MWKQTCHEWQCQQSRAIFYQQCACALNILSHCECFHVTCFMGSWRTQSIVFWSFLIHSILLSFSLLDTLVTYDLTNQLSIIKLWMHYVFHQFVFRVNDCVDGFNCGGFSCVRIDTWIFYFWTICCCHPQCFKVKMFWRTFVALVHSVLTCGIGSVSKMIPMQLQVVCCRQIRNNVNRLSAWHPATTKSDQNW